MKPLRVSLLLVLAAGAAQAQEPAGAPPAAATPVSALRTAEELDRLLGPIALYPDALIAIILPASTVPTDVVLAARHLRDNPNDRAQIEHRAWDESVKSLTSYPQVLQWMDENLSWTKQVGEAFASQPAEVMQAIQRLRARARTAGTLIDTPQQTVITEPQVIRIVPAQPDIIYVPYYEPEVVFVDRPYYYPYPRPFLTFGFGVPVGSWLAFECDWGRRSIWVGNRHRRWVGHDWRQPVVPIAPVATVHRSPETRQWRPPVSPVRPPFSVAQARRAEIVRPLPPHVAATPPAAVPANAFVDRRIERDAANAQAATRVFRSRVPAELPESRAAAAVIANAPAAVVSIPASPAPNLQPLPQARRHDGETAHDHDAGRSFRGSAMSAAPATQAVPVTPPASAPAPAYTSPPAARTYSRAAPPPAPAAPSVSQLANRAAATAIGAPATAPVSTPVAQPAAQPAPPAHSSENRSYRGGGGRRDENASVR